MSFIAEGVLLGLTLTIMIGPIFIALTQTGIEHGLRAGLSVGSGIWFSDILVISLAYYFIHNISGRISEPGFAQWSGLAGGLILMGFGIAAFFKDHRGEEKTPGFDARSYRGYFLKGFLVNFVNPFTFFFWTSVMTTYVVTRKSGGLEILLVFGSILVTIICTDSLKVALAKSIRSKLKRHHINYLGKIAGLLLVGFGISLIVRTSFL